MLKSWPCAGYGGAISHKNSKKLTVLICADYIDIFGQKHLITSTKDISEQKLYEEMTKEQLKLLESFSQAIADVSGIVDEDGTIIRLFNSKLPQAIAPGKNIRDILSPETTAKLLSLVCSVLRDKNLSPESLSLKLMPQ